MNSTRRTPISHSIPSSFLDLPRWKKGALRVIFFVLWAARSTDTRDYAAALVGYLSIRPFLRRPQPVFECILLQ